MDNRRVERKLAAILAADVAGYSRLMGADEVGTLTALKAHRRELIDPMISAHHGRMVKTTGDGALVEFASVVDAVTCAISIQRGIATRNAAIPGDKRIVFRIGINVGDVIIEDDDVFGDGVNIAARLEALCDPGGVYISQSTHDQIRDKLPLSFADLGEQKLKNIARPLGIFGLTSKDIGAIPDAAIHQPSSSLAGEHTITQSPARLSIAVMPFDNLSGDAGRDYFGDGLVDGLTTDLSSHVANLLVIARGSAFSYKGKSSIDPKVVGRELGARTCCKVACNGPEIGFGSSLVSRRPRKALNYGRSALTVIALTS